jgi:hypothetical protein
MFRHSSSCLTHFMRLNAREARYLLKNGPKVAWLDYIKQCEIASNEAFFVLDENPYLKDLI